MMVAFPFFVSVCDEKMKQGAPGGHTLSLVMEVMSIISQAL